MADVKDRAILGRWTQNYANEGNKILGAAKVSMGQGFEDIKAIFGENVSAGRRFGGVARVGGVSVGAYMAGDALLRSKTADGEDRSLLARVGQFLLGGGVAAGSLIVGRGR